MRYSTGGESHGPFLTAILEGAPAGIPLSAEDIRKELARRKGGPDRSPRMKLEKENAVITGGVRNGLTTGGPVVIQIPNSEYREGVTEKTSQADAFFPRPGHADLAGVLKFGFAESRNVIERASARETASRVAAGTVAKRFLGGLNVSFASAILQAGHVKCPSPPSFEKASLLDPEFPFTDKRLKAKALRLIRQCQKTGETIGGKVWVCARGVVPGVGGYAEWESRLDARLAFHLMSIPSVKGVLIGGIEQSVILPGSKAQDELIPGAVPYYRRKTNLAGGMEGGVSNGEDITATLILKPVPSSKFLRGSVDLRTLEPALPEIPRNDIAALTPAAVIAESLLAMVLMEAYLDKFGRDSMKDIRKSLAAYRKRLGSR